jgi:methyl-accepting chemotaxis protein
MDFLNNVKGTVCNVVETVSNVAQSYVERNRTKAKLNRLRMVMKSESELMNRAYIALGKDYYELLKKGDGAALDEKQENLLKLIDNSKAKISRARDCYRRILEDQTEDLYTTETNEKPVPQEDVVDITVACSNEDDYSSSPFENVSAAAEDVKDALEDTVDEVAEKAETTAETVKEKAEDTGCHISKAVKEALDEEYPDGEPF